MSTAPRSSSKLPEKWFESERSGSHRSLSTLCTKTSHVRVCSCASHARIGARIGWLIGMCSHSLQQTKFTRSSSSYSTRHARLSITFFLRYIAARVCRAFLVCSACPNGVCSRAHFLAFACKTMCKLESQKAALLMQYA